jgi:hypothetical protein
MSILAGIETISNGSAHGDRSARMTEIVFTVEEDPEGGYAARAHGASIFTQADTIDALREAVKDAVRCHFADDMDRPKIIRLHYVRDEVIAA